MIVASKVREQLYAALPPGTIVTAHTDDGHFYKDTRLPGDPFASVTGFLQILKEEGIAEWKMGQALEYVFAHYKEFTSLNILDHIAKAEAVSVDKFHDAGYIGTDIHQYREDYFNEWIRTGEKPANILDFIPPEQQDVRAIAGLRGIARFVEEWNYTPVVCEMLLTDEELKLGGTLDDLGIVRAVERIGNPNCVHNLIGNHCLRCDYKFLDKLVLLDLKTSNQFKTHYWFQVALYYYMLYKQTGVKPDYAWILKVDKVTGMYKLEKIRQIPDVIKYAKHLLKTHEGVELIKQLRKPIGVQI